MTTPPCINGDESHILTSLGKKQVTKDYIRYNSIKIKCKNMPNKTIYYLGRFSIYLSIYLYHKIQDRSYIWSSREWHREIQK